MLATSSRQGLPRRPKRLLLGLVGMEWLLERQIQVHRPCRSQRPLPERRRQALQLNVVLVVKPLAWAAQKRAANGGEKLLLIHGLVSAAVLQARRSVGREQQQGNAGPISLDGCGQQIGHSRSRGGDHRCGTTGGLGQPEGMESS